MKKIAIGALLIILIIAIQVTYLNYRVQQKLADIEQNQQNILTKVYSLERSTAQMQQSVRQALEKQQLSSKKQHPFLLTDSHPEKKDKENLKVADIN